MALPFIEDVADVGSERYEPEEMFLEEALALFRAALSEHATRGGQLDGTVLELGELQNVEGLGNRKEVVDFEAEPTRDPGQRAPSIVRR